MTDGPSDGLLEALDALVHALNQIPKQVDPLAARAEFFHRERARGTSYAEIVSCSRSRLVSEELTEVLAALLEAVSRLRRAEATALYAEGLSMDKIAHVFGVSRQRVSALLRTPAADGAEAGALQVARDG